MSELSNLSWAFPVAEMSQYMRDNWTFIMPLFVVIVGVLLAILVLESITDIFLKLGMFIVGNHYGRSTFPDFDVDIGAPRAMGHELVIDGDYTPMLPDGEVND